MIPVSLPLFSADRLFLIAGPCQLEDDTLNLRVGEALARLAEHVPGGIIFKASFDKANRSNVDGVRGPGLASRHFYQAPRSVVTAALRVALELEELRIFDEVESRRILMPLASLRAFLAGVAGRYGAIQPPHGGKDPVDAGGTRARVELKGPFMSK